MGTPRNTISLPALLAESAKRWNLKAALWRYVDLRFEPVSYAALMMSVARMADRLRERGAGPGTRVALRAVDRFSFGVTQLAIVWTGAAAVPLDPMLTPTETSGILNDAEAMLLVSDNADACRDEMREKIPLILLPDIWPGFGESPPTSPEPPEIDPTSLASLIFTSGTTGYSKGVMLTHSNIVSNIRSIQKMELLHSSDRLLSVLPMHHSFESTAGFFYPLSIGAEVFYARSLKSNEIREDLRAASATVILAVPLLFEKMAAGIRRKVAESSPGKRLVFEVLQGLSRAGHKVGWRQSGQVLFRSIRKKAGLDSLRLVVSGGAALPADVSEFFDVLGIPLSQGYGLTEASPVVAVNRPGKQRYDTVGPALPGVEVRIDDPGPEGIGEIALSGASVMKGYWHKPEETAKVLRDGWLLTGDLGSIDPDGHIHVVGRSKNVIISGAGKNIYPEELESVLDSQPGIAESMVYGRKREGKTGEGVAAIIVPDREWLGQTQPASLSDLTVLHAIVAQAVANACRLMAPYKRIVEWDLRDEPFEKTSTRKIKRAIALKQLEQARHQSVSSSNVPIETP